MIENFVQMALKGWNFVLNLKAKSFVRTIETPKNKNKNHYDVWPWDLEKKPKEKRILE
jgi:hypothetical protein